MRRVSLNLLRCPRCRTAGLLPEADTAELVFGPLRCPGCRASFPVAEGVADLVTERGGQGLAQKGLEQPLVARAYERYLRPAIHYAILRNRFDRDSEFVLYRSLLGRPDGPVLDLGCGTGLLARQLAGHSHFPVVIGMDRSRPMIEEGVAQAREAGVAVDFCRAEAPQLPFQDRSMGAVLQSSSLHFVEDEPALFLEISRVLRPGGVYVASSYLPPSFGRHLLHRRLGLIPRSIEVLERGLASAGLTRFERVSLPPLVVVRAEKPLA